MLAPVCPRYQLKTRNSWNPYVAQFL